MEQEKKQLQEEVDVKTTYSEISGRFDLFGLRFKIFVFFCVFYGIFL